MSRENRMRVVAIVATAGGTVALAGCYGWHPAAATFAGVGAGCIAAAVVYMRGPL